MAGISDRRTQWATFLFLLLLHISGSQAQAKYSGGSGTADDPYRIATAEDLITLGETPEDYGRHFILTADIDLDPNLPGRKVFDKAVIAPNTGAMEGWFKRTPFSGVFNGNGHTISNLTCHLAGQMEMEVGLFGWVADPKAEIVNLGLIEPHVYSEGIFSTGSLVGYFRGTIRNCYVEGGTVTGSDGYVGGLVGSIHGRMVGCYSTCTVVGNQYIGGLAGGNYGRVTNCYSIGSVTGRRDVGGLVGYNARIITDCYSAGLVNGDINVGGLLGRTKGHGRSTGSVEINCFWDMEASSQTESAGGIGLTTAEMQDPNSFMAAGWDFVGLFDGPHDIWAESMEGAGYPVLSWQLPRGYGLPEFSGGKGERDDPYLVSNPEEWNRIGHNPRLMGAHFKLTNNIDLADAESFIIGNEYYPFKGVFNGNGHTVTNFSYGSAQHDYVGLFGYVSGRNARIEALGVSNAGISVDRGYGVGSLVGCLGDGSISGCFVRGGSIGGRGIHVGGLIGRNYSIISNCYAEGVEVSGRAYVGGLVGLAYSGGAIINCYSSSNVSGDRFLGGLVGRCPGEDVVASFWDIETSGQITSSGGTAKTTAEMQTASTFLGAGWDFVDETVNGTEDIWWILEGRSYPRLWWQYGRPFSPYPQDGAADVVQPVVLSWLPGGSTLSHQVYFGEDKETIANATAESLDIYRGHQPSEMTTYDPGPLALDRTYYWRIDEVDEVDPNNLHKGNAWCFATANFIVVDDFEGYGGFGNQIWRSWHDGLGYGVSGTPDSYPGNGTGSCICDEIPENPCPEDIIVHEGRYSIPYHYDNNKQGFAKYSEAEKTLRYPRDWTQDGVSELSLWFRKGNLANDSEPMYVAIANTNGSTAAVYHDDPNATQINTWTEWTIDLREFANQGIDLADVNSIAIGFGIRGNMAVPGGSGQMYFDDIRLYQPRPATSYN